MRTKEVVETGEMTPRQISLVSRNEAGSGRRSGEAVGIEKWRNRERSHTQGRNGRGGLCELVTGD